MVTINKKKLKSIKAEILRDSDLLLKIRHQELRRLANNLREK